MAVDSKAKRFSATQLFIPSYTQSAVPSGTVSRPAAAWMYMGISIGAGLASGLMTVTIVATQPGVTIAATQPGITIAATQPTITVT